MQFRQLFRKSEFRSRSAERDNNTDRHNILPILTAIDNALNAFGAERAGLDARMSAAQLKASVMVGNDADEYLSRDAADTQQLVQAEREMKNAQARLELLRENIARLEELRAGLLGKFPAVGQPAGTVVQLNR